MSAKVFVTTAATNAANVGDIVNGMHDWCELQMCVFQLWIAYLHFCDDRCGLPVGRHRTFMDTRVGSTRARTSGDFVHAIAYRLRQPSTLSRTSRDLAHAPIDCLWHTPTLSRTSRDLAHTAIGHLWHAPAFSRTSRDLVPTLLRTSSDLTHVATDRP